MTRPRGSRAAIILAFAIAATLTVTACIGSAPGSTIEPSSNPDPGGLDGRTFISSGTQGIELVPGTQIRLSFMDGSNGSIGASAGCNQMGGSYQATGGRITTDQLFMTEMGCDAPRAEQDQWLATFIGDVAYTLDGDKLTLTDGTVTLTLLDETIANPDRPLEGTLWVVDGLVSGEAVSSVPVGVEATIRIEAGMVAVDTGCNTGGGPVTVNPESLVFGPISLTKRACQPSAGTVEAAITAVLDGEVSYVIDGDVLTLDAGENGLILRAAA